MTYGRRSYGSHRTMTPAYKAANVAASIKVHGYNVNEVSVWQKYGLEGNPAQQELVREALSGTK